jgi:hypothetical protein
MATVIALVDGPLSNHESLVMYATAVAGVARPDLASVTGLTDADVQVAVAQLTRRGLLNHPVVAHWRCAPPRPTPPAA